MINEKIMSTVLLFLVSIIISLSLMSCRNGKKQLEENFDIKLRVNRNITDLRQRLVPDEYIWGLEISPKKSKLRVVDGKVVFKKIKISYTKNFREEIITVDKTFDINLNKNGYSQFTEGDSNYALHLIKDLEGNKIFKDVDIDNISKAKDVELLDCDAYFEGTIEEKKYD